MSNIIFDFDGTIADSFDFFVHFIAEEARKSPLSEHQLTALRGLSLMATARKLGHNWLRLPGLYYAGKQWMAHFGGDLEPFDRMPLIIKRLNSEGHKLFIVSSNSAHNIETFLSNNMLDSDFIKIYGNVGFRGKARVLRAAMRQNKLDKVETCYIGDEPRDIRAAKKVGLQSIGVTWGYTASDALKLYSPDKLLERPSQLLDLFAKA